MPTLCALAGADTGSPLGIDLSSVLLDKKTVLKDRSPLVWTGDGYGGQVAVSVPSKEYKPSPGSVLQDSRTNGQITRQKRSFHPRPLQLYP